MCIPCVAVGPPRPADHADSNSGKERERETYVCIYIYMFFAHVSIYKACQEGSWEHLGTSEPSVTAPIKELSERNYIEAFSSDLPKRLSASPRSRVRKTYRCLIKLHRASGLGEALPNKPPELSWPPLALSVQGTEKHGARRGCITSRNSDFG